MERSKAGTKKTSPDGLSVHSKYNINKHTKVVIYTKWKKVQRNSFVFDGVGQADFNIRANAFLLA